MILLLELIKKQQQKQHLSTEADVNKEFDLSSSYLLAFLNSASTIEVHRLQGSFRASTCKNDSSEFGFGLCCVFLTTFSVGAVDFSWVGHREVELLS